MFVEDLSVLPEDMREQFVEFERDGKKGFQDKDTVALVNSMRNAKAEKDELRGKFEEISGKLSTFEKSQKEAIEQARAEALEQARSKGDVKALEERYQQQMADLEKRAREETRLEVTNEFQQQSATSRASSIANEIGLTLGLDSDAGEAIADLIRSRIKVDPATGKDIYHDAQGSALSVDRKGFEAELAKESRFKRLIKGSVPTSGGGFAHGNSNGVGNSQQLTAEQKRIAEINKRFNRS